MKPSSKITLAVAGALLAVAALLVVVNTRPRPDRDTLIKSALSEVEQAAKARSVGGVMQFVSSDYKDASNLNKDRLALMLARSYRMARGQRYNVHVNVLKIVPDAQDPKNAALVFATVAVLDPASGQELYGNSGQPLTLQMRREPGRRYLLFPEDHWRIVSVVNMPPLPGLMDDEGGRGGGGLGALLGL
jgi:hypothetical protein